MCSVNAWSPSTWMWCNRMWRGWLSSATDCAAHRMMMCQSWLWLTISGGWSSGLLSSFGGVDDRIGPVLVRRMIKKPANIVHEKRVELLGDLLFVCKVKRSLEGNPIINQYKV